MARILLLGEDRRAALAGALQGHQLVFVPDGEKAPPADLTIADFPRTGAGPLLLLCSYDELPEVIAAHGAAAFRVMPRTASADKIAAAALEALRPAEADEESVSNVALDRAGAAELLRWTALRLAQVRGAVVRRPDAESLQLQFVLTGNRRIEGMRADVVGRWLWPLKERGARTPRPRRGHPVLRLLGDPSPESEVYARSVRGAEAHVYLALLPWRRERRFTAVLGVCAGADRPDFAALLLEAHRRAVSEIAEFRMPAVEEPTGAGRALLEYDWIMTDSYVGPDRRRAPTSFLNGYLFTGRRRRVPSRVLRVSGSFTDRFVARSGPLAAAFLLLAALDAALTLACVRAGLVHEANPLLRPLVLHHPWAFLACKGGVSVGAFLIAARFRLFRFGLGLLQAVVAVYALVAAYWLFLLVR